MGKKRAKKKRKLSHSYEKFERTVTRSLNLISLQEVVLKRLSTAGEGEVDAEDLTRAAVVLSVAAMDAYFTNVFAERFIPFLRKRGPTDKICEILNEAGLGVRTALDLLTRDRPYRRIRTLVEQYYERHTMQTRRRIDGLFSAYDIKNLSRRIQGLKKRKRVLRSVEIIVERRHKIVHEGDLDGRGKLREIKAKEIKKRIMDIVTYVSGAEEILQREI